MLQYLAVGTKAKRGPGYLRGVYSFSFYPPTLPDYTPAPSFALCTHTTVVVGRASIQPGAHGCPHISTTDPFGPMQQKRKGGSLAIDRARVATAAAAVVLLAACFV